jgi:hypothetical protein
MSLSTVGGSVPVGSMFGLGWLMAKLFDPRRQESVTERQPPFNPEVQLPLVAELDPADRLSFLVVDLGDLLTPYEQLSNKAVKAEADKRKPGSAEPFDSGKFTVAVTSLHQAVLDQLADQQEQLSSYQLGLALSDMCWLPSTTGGPDAFIGMFERGQVAALKVLLDGAGAAIPASSSAVVGKSLENWQDWIDVNAQKLRLMDGSRWAQPTNPMLKALRIQGQAWHSILTADPDVSVQPVMGAWVQAASSMARASRTVSLSVLRRFWPIVVITAAALGGLLYLVAANLSGASQFWASLVTITATLGCGGVGLGTSVSRAFGGIGSELWSAAKLDAQVWNITWLPALPQSMAQRTLLDERGVAAPQIRKNLQARQLARIDLRPGPPSPGDRDA